MKKVSAIILALLLVFSLSLPSQATEVEATTEHPQTTEYPNDITRAPDLVSNAAIVMDAATGRILYEKNAYEAKYPASITKVLTTLVALEHNINFDEVITMSENAVWGIERDSTNIGLDVGEQVTVRDIVYATMVKSANECAYAVAEHVAGDLESFANLMNQKAADLGCQNSHFVNSNGLHDDNHYTCAYDMATITREALKNDTFREIAGTLSYTVPPTNLSEEPVEVWNGNKMINAFTEYYYEYCEGGKTGYTMKANNTLITFSKKDGLELICVVLDCDGARYAYSDSRALYNYCYNNYSYFYPLSDFSFDDAEDEVMEQNTILKNYYNNMTHDMVDLTIDKTYSLLVSRSMDTTQIQKEVVLYDKAEGNVLGEIKFTYDGEQIGSTSITTTTPLLSSAISDIDGDKEEKSESVFKTVIKWILIVVTAIILIFLIYVVIVSFIREIRRKKRRRSYYGSSRRRRYKDDDYFF